MLAVAFLTPANSYPLRYDGLKPIPDGAFAGHLQAEPSISHLQELLLHVWRHPEEAAAKGALARADMVRLYTPTRLARFVQHQIARIEALIAERNEL